uniref:uncharacterized protein DDB_G0290685-like n=1 Tax=Erigeron canadensis TaxID=72917 RepID=UPI001CB91BEE|nr:uncharacterized protein DDB_G0290685-like [Erigeron canadensis]
MLVYCDHFGVNLDNFVQNDKDDPEEIDVEAHKEGLYDTEEQEIDNKEGEKGENNDGGGQETENNDGGGEETKNNDDDGEETENNDGGGQETKNNDGGEDSDEDYVAEEEDGDVGFAASLDHLSEGEDEVRSVRQGQPIAQIPNAKLLPRLDPNYDVGHHNVNERSVIQEEHEEFLKELVQALTNNKIGEEYQDPLQPPTEATPVFPVHDKATHWRLKQPKVGEKYNNVEDLKECLTYYGLANGYSLWYERSCSESLIARCGNRPPRLQEPCLGK